MRAIQFRWLSGLAEAGVRGMVGGAIALLAIGWGAVCYGQSPIVIYTNDFNSSSGGLSTLGVGQYTAKFAWGGAYGTGGSASWYLIYPGDKKEEQMLTTPAITVLGTGPVTVSFNHKWSWEDDRPGDGTIYDGAQLDISTDAVTYTYVTNGAFTAGGYEMSRTFGGGTVSGWPMGAYTWAWTNWNYTKSGDASFIHSVANLGTFTTGTKIYLRFRASTDDGGGGSQSPAWVIDNLVLNTTS